MAGLYSTSNYRKLEEFLSNGFNNSFRSWYLTATYRNLCHETWSLKTGLCSTMKMKFCKFCNYLSWLSVDKDLFTCTMLCFCNWLLCIGASGIKSIEFRICGMAIRFLCMPWSCIVILMQNVLPFFNFFTVWLLRWMVVQLIRYAYILNDVWYNLMMLW